MVSIVDVEGDELKDWSERTQFLKLLQDACENDFGAEVLLFDLIGDACITVLRKVAPQVRDQDSFTLQRYYNPQIIFYKLAGDGKDITAIPSLDTHQHPMIARLLPEIAKQDFGDNWKRETQIRKTKRVQRTLTSVAQGETVAS